MKERNQQFQQMTGARRLPLLQPSSGPHGSPSSLPEADSAGPNCAPDTRFFSVEPPSPHDELYRFTMRARSVCDLDMLEGWSRGRLHVQYELPGLRALSMGCLEQPSPLPPPAPPASLPTSPPAPPALPPTSPPASPPAATLLPGVPHSCLCLRASLLAVWRLVCSQLVPLRLLDRRGRCLGHANLQLGVLLSGADLEAFSRRRERGDGFEAEAVVALSPGEVNPGPPTGDGRQPTLTFRASLRRISHGEWNRRGQDAILLTSGLALADINNQIVARLTSGKSCQQRFYNPALEPSMQQASTCESPLFCTFKKMKISSRKKEHTNTSKKTATTQPTSRAISYRGVSLKPEEKGIKKDVASKADAIAREPDMYKRLTLSLEHSKPNNQGIVTKETASRARQSAAACDVYDHLSMSLKKSKRKEEEELDTDADTKGSETNTHKRCNQSDNQESSNVFTHARESPTVKRRRLLSNTAAEFKKDDSCTVEGPSRASSFPSSTQNEYESVGRRREFMVRNDSYLVSVSGQQFNFERQFRTYRGVGGWEGF